VVDKKSEEELYKEASKRVRARKDFYTHLAIYICVNVFLIIIWAVTSRGFPWFVFPLGGWGIGIIFHGLDVFVFQRQSDIRAIEKEVAKLKQEQK